MTTEEKKDDCACGGLDAVYASIDALVDFARKRLELDPRDADWTRNRIFELFSLDSYRPTGATSDDTLPDDLLTRFRAAAVAAGATVRAFWWHTILGALPAALQMRVLALMDDRGARPFRIIASAHGSLRQLRAEQRLTDDLYYRLGLAEIEVPPLRDREGDVYLLMAQFIREAASRHNRRFPELTQQDLRPYRSYHWPGNLRELRNVAEKLVIGLKVTLQASAPMAAQMSGDLGYDEAMREFESSLLRAALQKTGGRKAEAAAALGIPRKRLYLPQRRRRTQSTGGRRHHHRILCADGFRGCQAVQTLGHLPRHGYQPSDRITHPEPPAGKAGKVKNLP